MNILVIGQGGREHAIIHSIVRNKNVQKVYAAPGNAGISELATCVPISAGAIEGLLRFAKEKGIDLTVVGPEAPLVAGISDRFNEAGLKVFGPSRAASLIEGSKSFSKNIMQEAGVATAQGKTFTEVTSAEKFASELGFPVVVKADGLAAGKGVVICGTLEEVHGALSDMIEHKAFGEAGCQVLVEEYLEGEECSILALTDGERFLMLSPSQDHKRLKDHDRGPNTGGMGAYSPCAFVNESLEEQIGRDIFQPVIQVMASHGTPYRGVLYAGVILTSAGLKVLEFNCRLGDPEAQAVLPRLKTDLLGLMLEVAEGALRTRSLVWDERACVSVVLASGGYPKAYAKGKQIQGLEKLRNFSGVTVFHAGTRREGEHVITDGGRVLAVSALEADTLTARKKAYQAVDLIQFEGMTFRKDIALKRASKVKC
jgi:phosphoribosylamine---glycine ligase